MNKIVLLVLLTVSGVSGASSQVRLSYISAGASMYGVLADREGPYGFRKDSYFNSVKVSAYLKIYRWTATVGVPQNFNLDVFDVRALSRYGIHPGDLSLQVGRRFGFISPRLIFKMPLGYPTDDDVAWIGSGNLKAGIGAGFALGQLMNRRIRFSGDAELLVSVNDTAGYPRMGIGTTGGYAVVKSAVSVSDRMRVALQLYSDFSFIRYSDWSYLPQQSVTIAPMVSLSRDIGKRFTAATWGGFGPKFVSTSKGVASKVIIFGVSTGISL